jgi:organic hydroperoxide reductase OsmC/OhrA
MSDETYNYEVNIQWNSERKGTLSSPVLPTQIEVVTPPEFPKGQKNIWSPEHLFVASVNACLMATFLAIAENSKFEFISYECNAVGILGKVEGILMITEITLKPKVHIHTMEHEIQLRRILQMSENACAVSNSIKTNIILTPVIVSD